MVKEFRIVLNTPPNQVYFPGSEVSRTGTLVVEVKDQAKSYKYIRISLQGYAHVKWSQVAIRMLLGIRPRLTVRTYTSKEVYVSATLVVWSRELYPGRKLEHGSYSYPFRFTLPSVLPSSFQSSIGIVRYTVEGRIGTGALKFDHVIQTNIPVVEVVNVYIPTFQVPVCKSMQINVCCLCCATGPVAVTVQLPRTGYCVGEKVPLNVEVQNGSNKRLRLRAILEQRVVYTAEVTKN